MFGSVRAFTRAHHCFSSLAFKVGADFVMHNTDVFSSTNSAIFDGVWHLADHSLLLFLASSPNSTSRVRQAAASLAHLQRLLMTSALSLCDWALTDAAASLFRNTKFFDTCRSKRRALKRLMLTLVRNGGVYREMYDIVASLARLTFDYADVLDAPPFTEPANLYDPPTRSQLTDLLEDELNTRWSDVFTALPNSPTEATGSIFRYDCWLKDGLPVTISIEPPHLVRMRRYDLLPFRCLSGLMRLVPPLAPEKALLDAVLRRVDTDLRAECSARIQILEKFGVRPQADIAAYFNAAKAIPLPLFVPAPIPRFSTRHVLVSDRQWHKDVPESTLKLFARVKDTAALLKDEHLILRNLGRENIRTDGTGFSLAQFCSLLPVAPGAIQDLGRLAAAKVAGQRQRFVEAATRLGLRERAAAAAYRRRGNWQTVRFLLPKQADLVVASAEALAGLGSHAAPTVGKIRTLGLKAAQLFSLFA